MHIHTYYIGLYTPMCVRVCVCVYVCMHASTCAHVPHIAEAPAACTKRALEDPCHIPRQQKPWFEHGSVGPQTVFTIATCTKQWWASCCVRCCRVTLPSHQSRKSHELRLGASMPKVGKSIRKKLRKNTFGLLKQWLDHLAHCTWRLNNCPSI